VLLRDELITMGKMEDVGVEYIAKVMDSIPSSANAIYYAKIVREKYQLRKLIAACKDICDSAFEQGETVDELIDQAKASIFATDLRESGSIEQDADVVLLLLHREDYYQKGQADYCNTNVADIIVAKQRNGATGAIKLTFLSELSRFESYAPSEQ
jgi:replicative DNA helicase